MQTSLCHDFFMEPAGPSQYAEVAEVFAALASPVRSALVHHLTTGPKTVGALVESLELSQPLVSQHLRILRGARLVTATKDGRHTVYSLVDEHVAHVFLDAFHHTEEHPT